MVCDCVHQIFINADTTKESGERKGDGKRGRRWGAQPKAPANASALSAALYLPPLLSFSAIYELLPFPPSLRPADRTSSLPKRKVMQIFDTACIGAAADVENITAIMMKEQHGRDGRERTFYLFIFSGKRCRHSVSPPYTIPSSLLPWQSFFFF